MENNGDSGCIAGRIQGLKGWEAESAERYPKREKKFLEYWDFEYWESGGKLNEMQKLIVNIDLEATAITPSGSEDEMKSRSLAESVHSSKKFGLSGKRSKNINQTVLVIKKFTRNHVE